MNKMNRFNFRMNDLKITADYREKSSGLIDLLKDRGVVVELKSIPCGDYIINDTITIERKTANDFLISIINGRLFRQLLNLKKFCANPILLVEGNPFKTTHNFDKAAIKGALISMQVVWYIPTIFSHSVKDSRDILLMISRQIETCVDVVSLRGCICSGFDRG